MKHICQKESQCSKNFNLYSQVCSSSTSMLTPMTLRSRQPFTVSCSVLHSGAATQRRSPGFVWRIWRQWQDVHFPALQSTHVLGMVSVCINQLIRFQVFRFHIRLKPKVFVDRAKWQTVMSCAIYCMSLHFCFVWSFLFVMYVWHAFLEMCWLQYCVLFGSLHIDLYAGLIVNYLEQNLYVRSWGKKRSVPLLSNCSLIIPHNVYNVKEVRLLKGKPYRDTVDHSKWCVTPDRGWTCIADMNREESQMKRGGGAICTDDIAVGRAFNALITRYEQCKRERPPSVLHTEL